MFKADVGHGVEGVVAPISYIDHEGKGIPKILTQEENLLRPYDPPPFPAFRQQPRTPPETCPGCNFQVRGPALAALVALLLASAALGQELVIRGRCVGVHDGDSVTQLASGNVQIKVRIAFLDAPELGQPFRECSQAGNESVRFRQGDCRLSSCDRPIGRTVGVVYVDGIDAGLELLRQGLCWVNTRYLPEAGADIQASYRQAETEAWVQQRGLWSERDPIPPWEYRRAGKKAN